MRRLLATVAAIAMVVVAVVARSSFDDEERRPSTPDGADQLRLVCASELAEACTALVRSVAADGAVDVVVEEAPATADRLASAPAGETAIDVWIVAQPWPAMVDQVRTAAGAPPLFGPDPPAIARSPLVAVGGTDDEGCGWRCLGDRVGAGELRVGWRSPTGTSVGLLTVGAATTGYFNDPGVATNDFTPEFRSWLDRLVDAPEAVPSPVERQLQSQAFFDVSLSYEAEAERLLGQAAPERSEGLMVLYPEPVATLDIVLAPIHDAPVDRVAPAAERALADRGWRTSGPDRLPALPATNGLPGAGVLIALRDEAR